MRRTAALLVAAALGSAACVSQDDPGLKVQALSTDVAFGVEVAEPAGPPIEEPDVPLPETVSEGGFEPPQLGFRPFEPRKTPGLPPIRTTPPVDCPKAPPTAAAEKQATENATDDDGVVLPREGIYRWKREGKQTVPAGTGTVETTVGGFERRLVRNVEQESDTVFTYEVVAPLLGRNAVSITTYRVDTESVQYEPGGAVVIDEPRANDPEGGLSIQNIVIQEDDGRETSFNPSVGLLLLGLPVIPSEEFRSTAVDGRSGQSIIHDGKVLGRDRIDACGDLIDGWAVEATQARSDSAGDVTYDYLVATQYGAMIIREHVVQTLADGSQIDVTYTLGQLDPDPLPEGEDQ